MVTKTGTGGLSELRDALDDSKASYGYARVTYSSDKESQREKFILVVWIGSGCKVMRKAKVGLPVLCLRATPHVLSDHPYRVFSVCFSEQESHTHFALVVMSTCRSTHLFSLHILDFRPYSKCQGGVACLLNRGGCPRKGRPESGTHHI